jgi:hypothetical protein
MQWFLATGGYGHTTTVEALRACLFFKVWCKGEKVCIGKTRGSVSKQILTRRKPNRRKSESSQHTRLRKWWRRSIIISDLMVMLFK